MDNGFEILTNLSSTFILDNTSIRWLPFNFFVDIQFNP